MGSKTLLKLKLRALRLRPMRKFMTFCLLPVALAPLFKRNVGDEYRVGFFAKLKLLLGIRKITRNVSSATSWYEHILMAIPILKVPLSLKGAVVECGSYKGASTSTLSLVCSLAGRKLIIFDSFKGLPEPEGADRVHHIPNLKKKTGYAKGDYEGRLEEVKENIKQYGCLDVCEFVPGYFENTMPMFINSFNDRVVFTFLDVDLRKSLETCIFYLWPLLEKHCSLFTHEAQQIEMSSFFFDKGWWLTHLYFSPPGLLGAGTGLGLYTWLHNQLGCAIKT